MNSFKEEPAITGVCKACGQELISWQGDIWHPYTCAPCPVNIYRRPGVENFIPNVNEEDNEYTV